MTDALSLEAPESGYEDAFIIDMPKSLAEKWTGASERRFWIRFKDGTYGRIKFDMVAGGDHFSVVEGVRNPIPNDRNLTPKLE